MNELLLKYGCNPNQTPSRIYCENGALPVTVLNGAAGYINFLDALNGWQLVSSLKKATGLPAAASFKHVSPAGAALGVEMTEHQKKICFADGLDVSPLARAYLLARGADRMSSYGDFISLSDICDAATANVIKREVSDGVIAPGYEPEALEILKSKKKGGYTILQIDPAFVPGEIERRDVFGVVFEQGRNELKIDDAFFSKIVTKSTDIPESARRDLILALITLKYTQSNSVCYAKDGQTIGVGAGQQSRIHCTRLAGDKADKWYLRGAKQVLSLDFKDSLGRAERDNCIDIYLSDDQDEMLADGEWQKFFNARPEEFTRGQRREKLNTLTGVSLGSDAFFPFGDNIERAEKSGVSYIAQPGGSIRDDNVIETCDKYGIAMAFTGIRLFHH